MFIFSNKIYFDSTWPKQSYVTKKLLVNMTKLPNYPRFFHRIPLEFYITLNIKVSFSFQPEGILRIIEHLLNLKTVNTEHLTANNYKSKQIR